MHTKNGKLLISIILGIGAASIFRKVCTETNCLDFRGPDLQEVKDSIYGHNDLCYKFTPQSVTCNKTSQQVQL
tara:strand:+ start:3334 stop:3552 length:219 start_codon:yes stop_codon:yes gene_type:complete